MSLRTHVINSFFSGTETVTRDRHLEFKVVQVYHLDKAAAQHISGFFATQIWSELKLPRNFHKLVTTSQGRQKTTLLFSRAFKVPEPIYVRDGYVFYSRFSAGKIKPISMSFGIFNKERSNFQKILFIFLYT